MDINYLLALQNFRLQTNGVFDNFFLFITSFGQFVFPLALALGFYWCVNKKTGVYILFNIYWGALINGFLKITACVYRPWIRDPRIKPVAKAFSASTGYSFPSGHTAQGIAAYGGLAVKTKRKWLVTCLIFLVLLIAFSRNYLGVHTPQDVLTSLLIGSILLFILVKITAWIEKGKNRDLWVFIFTTLACVALTIYALVKSYPLDYVNGKLLVDPHKMSKDSLQAAGGTLGFVMAWLWERRGIKFELDGKVSLRIIRFLGGMATLGLIFVFTKKYFRLWFGYQAGSFVYAWLSTFYGVGLYPFIFKKIENKYLAKLK